MQGVGFGKRYGPNGEDLGDWNPGMYIGTQRDPIAKQIENYQELLATLREVLIHQIWVVGEDLILQKQEF